MTTTAKTIAPNHSLQPTAPSLRSLAAAELGRWAGRPLAEQGQVGTRRPLRQLPQTPNLHFGRLSTSGKLSTSVLSAAVRRGVGRAVHGAVGRSGPFVGGHQARMVSAGASHAQHHVQLTGDDPASFATVTAPGN